MNARFIPSIVICIQALIFGWLRSIVEAYYIVLFKPLVYAVGINFEVWDKRAKSKLFVDMTHSKFASINLQNVNDDNKRHLIT